MKDDNHNLEEIVKNLEFQEYHNKDGSIFFLMIKNGSEDSVYLENAVWPCDENGNVLDGVNKDYGWYYMGPGQTVGQLYYFNLHGQRVDHYECRDGITLRMIQNGEKPCENLEKSVKETAAGLEVTLTNTGDGVLRIVETHVIYLGKDNEILGFGSKMYDRIHSQETVVAHLPYSATVRKNKGMYDHYEVFVSGKEVSEVSKEGMNEISNEVTIHDLEIKPYRSKDGTHFYLSVTNHGKQTISVEDTISVYTEDKELYDEQTDRIEILKPEETGYLRYFFAHGISERSQINLTYEYMENLWIDEVKRGMRPFDHLTMNAVEEGNHTEVTLEDMGGDTTKDVYVCVVYLDEKNQILQSSQEYVPIHGKETVKLGFDYKWEKQRGTYHHSIISYKGMEWKGE